MRLKRKDKIKLIKDLVETLKEENTFLVTNFEGLTSEEINELRLRLFDEGMHYKAVKKTLIDLVLKRAELGGLEIKKEKGQIGLAWGSDAIKLAKVINNFSQSKNKDMIVAGFLEGDFLSKEKALSLAQLPSLEVLRAQLIGLCKSTMFRFVNVLGGNQRKLVMILNAIKEAKA